MSVVIPAQGRAQGMRSGLACETSLLLVQATWDVAATFIVSVQEVGNFASQSVSHVPWCRTGTWGLPRRSLEEKLGLVLDVARGMQALEEADPPIVHRDLKPSNIFIGAPR
jgi:serine/threonine protein kinase